VRSTGSRAYVPSVEEDTIYLALIAGHEPGEGATGLVLGASSPTPVAEDGSLLVSDEDSSPEQGHIVFLDWRENPNFR
jgi:hypothetical protein